MVYANGHALWARESTVGRSMRARANLPRHLPTHPYREAEHDEGDVRAAAPPDVDHLAHGVRLAGLLLELNGEDAEEQDLDGGAGRVPERAGDCACARGVGWGGIWVRMCCEGWVGGWVFDLTTGRYHR